MNNLAARALTATAGIIGALIIATITLATTAAIILLGAS